MSSSETPLRIGRKEVGLHEHAVLYVQDVHDLGQRKAQTLGPREHVLGDRFLPVVGVSLPFIAQYPLPPGPTSYCGVGVASFKTHLEGVRVCSCIF